MKLSLLAQASTSLPTVSTENRAQDLGAHFLPAFDSGSAIHRYRQLLTMPPSNNGFGVPLWRRGEPDITVPLRLSDTGPNLTLNSYIELAKSSRTNVRLVSVGSDHDLPESEDFYVIKMLEQRARDVDSIRRFETEGLLLSSLNHPNIVRGHGLLHVNLAGMDRLAILMEEIGGHGISQIIDNGFCVPASVALEIIGKIASALDYAHNEIDCVHRDIKPENVMITPDGQIKLIDFGLAIANIDGQVVDLYPGYVVGSLGYFPPEGETSNTKGRDVFALGILFLEMVLGRRLVLPRPKDKVAYANTLTIGIDEAGQLLRQQLGSKTPTILHLLIQMTNPNPQVRLSAYEVQNIVENFLRPEASSGLNDFAKKYVGISRSQVCRSKRYLSGKIRASWLS